jgi:hypothetical protein
MTTFTAKEQKEALYQRRQAQSMGRRLQCGFRRKAAR